LLKLQQVMGEISSEVKRKDQEVHDLQKKVQPSNLSMCEPSDLHLEFKKGIRKLATNIYPGKHNKMKAKILMEVLQDHQLFSGESAVCLKTSANDYIRNLFQPWKVVKAGDTSPVGAFKTSFIEELHEVIDEGNDHPFPSLKAAGKVKKKLLEE
jgi:hypothetical protein